MVKNSLSSLMLALMLTASAYADTDIVGGKTVPTNDVIAQNAAALVFNVTDETTGKPGTALCTVSILDESHAITAAHCVSGTVTQNGTIQAMLVFSPKVDLDKSNAIPQNLIRHVTAETFNPDWPGLNTKLQEYRDLGLITFEGGLPAGYSPINLMTAAQSKAYATKGAPVILAGYGTTGVAGKGSGTLREVATTIDQEMSKDIDIVVGTKGMVACHGDSGGPAIAQIDGENYLLGVASRSDCETFSIYTLFTQGESI